MWKRSEYVSKESYNKINASKLDISLIRNKKSYKNSNLNRNWLSAENQNPDVATLGDAVILKSDDVWNSGCRHVDHTEQSHYLIIRINWNVHKKNEY